MVLIITLLIDTTASCQSNKVAPFLVRFKFVLSSTIIVNLQADENTFPYRLPNTPFL